ncbi:MAG: hypothetical protein HS126_21605 [Anaerolineales bacterium]|nr:hypothetical protein [Anaerolineales bacterium]
MMLKIEMHHTTLIYLYNLLVPQVQASLKPRRTASGANQPADRDQRGPGERQRWGDLVYLCQGRL